MKNYKNNIAKLCIGALFLLITGTAFAQQPNVILILSDDQGYGDWGFRGTHRYLQTPHMDQLSLDGLFLTDLHVNVLCAPSRASIMSGRDAFSVRCWQGRHLLRADVPTLGSVFKANGYATAMFGKWHLGDNYPYRPIDRGFDEAIQIVNGVVATANDYPLAANNYWDPYLKHNDVWKPFFGYTTDIWFGRAMDFAEKNTNENKPFFIYLAPEAPHSPYASKEEDLVPYASMDIEGAYDLNKVRNFYGQIAGIDRNLGLLRQKLEELQIADNTILIYMGDNGSAAAKEVVSGAGFQRPDGHQDDAGIAINGGLTGGKANSPDGGHRVPFFIYWKDGGLTGGTLVDELASGMDMLPTLIDLCGLTPPANISTSKWDGISLKTLLENPTTETLPSRVIFTGYSTEENPPTGPGGPISMDKIRMYYNSGHLFDVSNDLAQSTNLTAHPTYAAQKTIMVENAMDRHTDYAANVFPFVDPFYLGNPTANPTLLHGAYWMNGSALTWFNKSVNPSGFNGEWFVKAENGGNYKISLYRWHPLREEPIRGGPVVLDIHKARLVISEIGFDQTIDVTDDEMLSVPFYMALPQDQMLTIKTYFYGANNNEICGAPVTSVQWMPPYNLSPITGDDSYIGDKNTPLVIASPGLLRNDSDGNEDVITPILLSGPYNGTLQLNADGSFTYTPEADFEGDDSFTYVIEDAEGAYSEPAKVTLTVRGELAAHFKFEELGAGTAVDSSGNNLSGVIKNLVNVQQPGVEGRSFKFNGAQRDRIELEENSYINLSGDDFTISAWVHPLDRRQYGSIVGGKSIGFLINENGYPRLTKVGLLGQSPAAATVAVPLNTWSHVAVTFEFSSGNIAYYVNGNSAGTVMGWEGSFADDSIRYLASDRIYTTHSFYGNLDEIRMYRSVLSPTDISAQANLSSRPPLAEDDAYNHRDGITVPAPGVLGNDQDYAGGTLSAQLETNPAQGSVVLNSDGSFTYTPNEGALGIDSFTYKARNSQNLLSSTRTVSLISDTQVPTIVAGDNVYSVVENDALSITAPGVLSNDFEPNGGAMIAVLESGVSNGVLNLNEDGSFTYTPTAGFVGSDQFTYKASDTNGTLSEEAVVSITITPMPVINGPANTTDCMLWLDANDVDGDGTVEGANEEGISEGLITAWVDKSNSGNGAAAAPGEEASLIFNAFNGKFISSFDGIDDTYTLNNTLSTMKTIFWVVQERERTDADDLHFIFGHHSEYGWHRGNDGALWHQGAGYAYTASSILSGRTYLNGQLIDGAATSLPLQQYQIISLEPSGNAPPASNLTKDRGIGRSWNGEIAEIIAYNRELTLAERQAVESYLDTKWLQAAPANAFDAWIQNYPGVGSNTDIFDDPDRDGYNNLVEFALGGNPTLPNTLHKPVSSLNKTNGLDYLQYIYVKRKNAASLALSYTVEQTTNLVDGSWSTHGVEAVGSGELNTDFDSVTNRLPVESQDAFMRLEIGIQ